MPTSFLRFLIFFFLFFLTSCLKSGVKTLLFCLPSDSSFSFPLSSLKIVAVYDKQLEFIPLELEEEEKKKDLSLKKQRCFIASLKGKKLYKLHEKAPDQLIFFLKTHPYTVAFKLAKVERNIAKEQCILHFSYFQKRRAKTEMREVAKENLKKIRPCFVPRFL